MAVGVTQLLLLTCIIAMSESLSCNDITCCTGTVCVEETRGNEVVSVRCITPPTCEELDCPAGFVCVDGGQGTTHAGASCEPSCDDVTCPEFLQCVVEDSTTQCVAYDECTLVRCPAGTSCTVVEVDDERVALCYADSCDSVTCSSGSECSTVDANSFDAFHQITARGTTKRDEEGSGSGNGGGQQGSSGGQQGSSGGQQGSSSGQQSSSSGQQSSGSEEEGSSSGQPSSSSGQQSSGSEEEESSSGQPSSASGQQGSGSGQQGSGSAQQATDVAVCMPRCAGANICPLGFVCEESDFNTITCREAQSCFELECPMGQECQEVTCGTRRARRSSTGTRPTSGPTSGSTGNVLLQCVGIPGGGTSEDPPALSRIGNDGAASITNGATSLAASSLAAGLVLAVCSFFLLHL